MYGQLLFFYRNMATIKKRPIHQYPEAALAAVREGLSIRAAARQFNVPKTTILNRIHGQIKEGARKMGPPTILSTAKESELVNWLSELADWISSKKGRSS